MQIVIVEGPRRVGKTTFIHNKANEENIRAYKENSFPNIRKFLFEDKEALVGEIPHEYFVMKDLSILEMIFSNLVSGPLMIDRLFVSSIVYGVIHRGVNLSKEIDRYKRIIDHLSSLSGMNPLSIQTIIYCDPDKQDISQSLLTERSERSIDDLSLFRDTQESISIENDLFMKVSYAFSSMIPVRFISSFWSLAKSPEEGEISCVE